MYRRIMCCSSTGRVCWLAMVLCRYSLFFLRISVKSRSRWLEEVIRAAERQGDPPEPFVGFESGFRAGRLGVVHAHMAGLAAPRRPAIGRVAP